MDAKTILEYGESDPYDGRLAVDAAHRAALGVMVELRGRRGIGQELDAVDEELRVELVDAVAEIIREAGLRD